MSTHTWHFPPCFSFFHIAPVEQPFTTIEQSPPETACWIRFYSRLLLNICLLCSRAYLVDFHEFIWEQTLRLLKLVGNMELELELVDITNLRKSSERRGARITNSWCGKTTASWKLGPFNCTLAMRCENWLPAFVLTGRASSSQRNNNGRQPNILPAPARCCRHWKVTDVASTTSRPPPAPVSEDKPKCTFSLLYRCHSASTAVRHLVVELRPTCSSIFRAATTPQLVLCSDSRRGHKLSLIFPKLIYQL